MLTLNYRDSRPIYEQIKDGLRRMIVTSAMAQDEKLPSVRENLKEDLRKLLGELRYLGMTHEDAVKLIKEVYEQ